jgi:hypothetical protein
MKRSHRFHRRALIRSWFALAAAGLIVGALATYAVAQADDEKPKATDAGQERVFSGPQPGEKIKFSSRTVTPDAPDKSRRDDREEPGRLRVAAHNLGEPMAVRPRVWVAEFSKNTGKSTPGRPIQSAAFDACGSVRVLF